jgi:16S rRNA (uracil1498-N3)-methyltransferase
MLSPDARPLSEFKPEEPAGGPLEITFAVGPEGDWSGAERDALIDNSFVPVSLGNRIMRASTAAIAGCGWFWLWGA